MGFQIAQNLDDRLILKNGVLMSHHATGQFDGEFGGIHPSQVDSRYQMWLDRVRELDEQTVKRTNGKQTYKSYTEQYDHEMWLTGPKSVEQGYADKVILVKCDSSLSGTNSRNANIMGFTVSYELDNCPLNTSPMHAKINTGDKQVSDEMKEEILKKFNTVFTNKQKQVIPLVF